MRPKVLLKQISRENRSYNLWARLKSYFFVFLGFVMPFALILSVITKQGETLQNLVGENMVKTLHTYTVSNGFAHTIITYLLRPRETVSLSRG